MAALLIGEVAHRFGIKPSAIRYYESVGLLPEPVRRGGRRAGCNDAGRSRGDAGAARGRDSALSSMMGQRGRPR